MDSRKFFGGGGPASLILPAGRSPAYPFFRKEKMQPFVLGRGCDAESPERALRRSPCAAQESVPHPGGSFFLYEKSVLRESDSLRGRKKEVCTDLTPQPFPPLKRWDSKGTRPFGRSSRAEPSRSSRCKQKRGRHPEEHSGCLPHFCSRAMQMLNFSAGFDILKSVGNFRRKLPPDSVRRR